MSDKKITAVEVTTDCLPLVNGVRIEAPKGTVIAVAALKNGVWSKTWAQPSTKEPTKGFDVPQVDSKQAKDPTAMPSTAKKDEPKNEAKKDSKKNK